MPHERVQKAPSREWPRNCAGCCRSHAAITIHGAGEKGGARAQAAGPARRFRSFASWPGRAKNWAAEKGCDSVFGVRPLKRFPQRDIETMLARSISGGQVAGGTEVKFTVKDDQLVMS